MAGWDVEFDSSAFVRAVKAETAIMRNRAEGPGLDHVGDDMAARASQMAPVRTGELARGIGWRRVGRDEIEVYSSSDHSLYVEYGTSDTKAQPFMRPTWAEAPGIYSRQMRGVF